jgi:hypothetical protein
MEATMNQQSGAGDMHFENAFNGASQNAVGSGARVNIGTPEDEAGMDTAPGAASPASGTISIINAFNNANSNAVGPGAQVNVHPGSLERREVPESQTAIWPARPIDQPIPASTGACKIIISYSHKDQQWLDLLRTHLAFLEQQHLIDLWDDSRIAVGAHRRQAIADALTTARFALLLVSANFLASNFIAYNELPLIRQRLSQSQITILPLILSPCLFEESPLGDYQPFNPDKPLSRLSFAQQEDVLVRVARKIYKVLQ